MSKETPDPLEQDRALVRERLTSIWSDDPVLPSCPPPILTQVASYDPDLVKGALGDIGMTLVNYSRAFDLDHPDIVMLCDGLLNAGTNISEFLDQLLKTAEFVRENKFHAVASKLRGLALNVDNFGTVVTNMENASNLGYGVRFIPDEQSRQSVRKSRRNREVSLETFYKNKGVIWDTLPAGFAGFVRGMDPYEEEVKTLRSQVDTFAQNGMLAMSQKVQKRVDELSAQTREQYLGFNRLSRGDASIILGKLHGFKYTEGYVQIDTEIVSKLAGEFRTALANIGVYLMPRIYPATVFKASEHSQAVMAHLDKFPALGSRPAFDHYYVLVASLTRGGSTGGEVHPAIVANDTALVEKGLSHGVLLGKRDEKSYFIDYWN